MPFTAPIVSAAIAIGTAALLANFPAKLKQIEGKHFTHRKHRDD